MKTIKFTFAILALSMMLACNTQVKNENKALKEEIAKLQEENAVLAQETMEMAYNMEYYHETMLEIDQLIAAIDVKKQLVTEKSPEYMTDEQVREDILMHLDHINEMMENSKHKINQLNANVDDLRNASGADQEKIHLMEEELLDMAEMVVSRDSEVDALHDMLEQQGYTIDALATAYEEQKAYSEVLVEILNTGYYVAGTKKELKEMGIIDLEGGFLGLGKVKSIKSNAPIERFTLVDIQDTKMIELKGKKASLITTHPAESYEFTFNKEKELIFLGVADVMKFWQESNYLVIEIEN